MDADLTRLDSTALSMEELSQLLSAIPAGRLLVLLDCCHAGGAAAAKAGAAAPPGLQPGLSEEQLGMLVTGQGRVVIASCRADEQSYVKAGDRNSMFTRFLLQALRGEGPMLGDGLVRAFDLFRHVSTHVPPYAAALNLQQHPLFKGEAMDTDFAVAACPP